MWAKREKWHYLLTIVLSIYCLFTATLFYVVIISSVKSKSDVLTNIWGLPKKLELSNFVSLLKDYNFSIYTRNSILITLISLIAVLYISSSVAYGIRKLGGRFSSIIFSYFLIGMMFPAQLGIVPLFLLVRDLRLSGTIFSVILIYAASISFSLFVLSGYLKTMPEALLEAAKIDGAGEMTIFHKIVMPLLKPVYGALIPLLAISTWNDFFIPLVFLNKNETKTIPIGLMRFYAGQFLDMSKLNLVFTAATLSIVPILVVYLLASDRIIKGIITGSIK